MAEPLVLTEEIAPQVLGVTLNRADQRNALSVALMEELCAAFDKIKGDTKNRVVVLRGKGPIFCAGLDLKEGRMWDVTKSSADLIARMLQTIYDCPLVTIALVQGAAIAGGAGLMSSCDFVLGAPGAKMGYPETRRGLVAGIVMTFMCRQMRERDVRELLLLADLIDSERAVQMGLINRVVPEDQLLGEALKMAEMVKKGAPKATALTKKVLDEIYANPVHKDIAHTLAFHLEMRQSPEAQEGMLAFSEKREPNWENL